MFKSLCNILTPESTSLILDNWWNLGLTFDLSVWIRQGGPIQVMEQGEVHGVEDEHMMMVIKLQTRKEEREKQNQGDQDKGIR